MSLFNLRKNCVICGAPALLRVDIAGHECLCFSCYDKCGFGPNDRLLKYYTADDIKTIFAAGQNKCQDFGNVILFDDNMQQCLIKGRGLSFCKYDEITDFALLEGETLDPQDSRLICNSLAVKLTVDNERHSTLFALFITSAVKKNSIAYTKKLLAAKGCIQKLQTIFLQKKLQERNKRNIN